MASIRIYLFKSELFGQRISDKTYHCIAIIRVITKVFVFACANVGRLNLELRSIGSYGREMEQGSTTRKLQ